MPVVGRPGDVAALTGAEAWDGMTQLQAIAHVPWENKVLARALLKIPYYRPLSAARKVTVPTLVIAGLQRQHRLGRHRAQGREPHAERASSRCIASDHFQPYYGDYLDKNVQTQLEFLQRHVAA